MKAAARRGGDAMAFLATGPIPVEICAKA